MSQRIAVVTGSNKGIGKAIVLGLLKKSTAASPLLVYLTGRNTSLVNSAFDELSSASLPSSTTLKQHQLDITDTSSIQTFADDLKSAHGQIDILINNAGIASKGSDFNADIVRRTVGCNYYGTQSAISILAPLIRTGGRIVNMSSSAGKLRNLSSQLQSSFSDPSLTMEQLDGLMKQFETDVDAGNHTKNGWPTQAYGVSKVGVTALTKVVARAYPKLLVNACCPGWVKTDMAGDKALKTPEQGAKTPVLLAVGDIGSNTGEFWENEKVSVW